MTVFSIQRLENAKDLPLPTPGTALSAGYDLCAAIEKSVLLKPGHRALIPCGFAIALAPLILPIRGENDAEIAESGGVGNRVVANLGDGARGRGMDRHRTPFGVTGQWLPFFDLVAHLHQQIAGGACVLAQWNNEARR